MTVGELKEMISSADDTAHVGVVFQSNLYYDPKPDRVSMEPAWHIYLSIEGVLIQLN